MKSIFVLFYWGRFQHCYASVQRYYLVSTSEYNSEKPRIRPVPCRLSFLLYLYRELFEQSSKYKLVLYNVQVTRHK